MFEITGLRISLRFFGYATLRFAQNDSFDVTEVSQQRNLTKNCKYIRNLNYRKRGERRRQLFYPLPVERNV